MSGNIFQEYVDRLDDNGYPVEQEHLSIIDDEGNIWSTRNCSRHQVVLAQGRAKRKRIERYEIEQQKGWFINWGLIFLMLCFIGLFIITFIIIG